MSGCDAVRHGDLRRDVREALLRVDPRRRRDRRLEEVLEHRALVFVVDPRAGGQIQPVVEGDGALTEHAETEVVQRRARRMLADGNRRHDERRIVVDRVLIVGLREEKHARLPAQAGAVRQRGSARVSADAKRTSCVNWKSFSVLSRVRIGRGV